MKFFDKSLPIVIQTWNSVLDESQNNRRVSDDLFRLTTGLSALIIPLLMIGLVTVMLFNSHLALKEFGLGFLTTDNWNPVTQEFGAFCINIDSYVDSHANGDSSRIVFS